MELEFNIKNAFHYGYILSLGHQVKPGENPLYSLFEDNIDAGRELRFTPPGVAADVDSKKALSGILGRSFALGVLNELYHFTWFASISNLRKLPENGWSAENKAPGNSPDFLAANSNSFAVAEAKGTSNHINTSSADAAEWRTQASNIIIKKNGTSVQFKSWIIATRFVLNTERRKFPEMLIEDPIIEGRRLRENDLPSLSRWIASGHVFRNLERLRLYNLIIRIREPQLGKIQVLVWQCIYPRLQHLRFVGGPLDFDPNQCFSYWDKDYFRHRRERVEFLAHTLQRFNRGFFDGQELEVVRDLANGDSPRPVPVESLINESYVFINLLDDGSLIAPMSLMRLVDIKEI